MPTTELAFAEARLTDGSVLPIPYWRVDSGKSGQVLLVMAAQHGNEVQGCEVVRRFRETCEQDLQRGAVYLVPFANPLAVGHRRSHLGLGPEQPYGDDSGHNMNRTWPGDPAGNDTQRLSHALYQAVVRHCTRCLDLHSWSRFTATCALVRGDVPLSDQMGAVSGVLFQMEVTPPPPATTGVPIGRLFNDHGLGSLTIELAPQWVIREREVALGWQAAVNLARLHDLFDGDPVLSPTPPVRFRQDDLKQRAHTLTAPVAGLFVEHGLQTSDRVSAGQPLGHILRADSLETVPVVAPVDGYLWQYGCHREHSDVALPPQHPYASAGDTLAAVLPA